MAQFPNFESRQIEDTYIFMNGGDSSKFLTLDQFQKTLLERVPLENKIDLLYEETKRYQKVFKSIVDEFKIKKVRKEQFFPQREMDYEKLIDQIINDLKVWQKTAVRRLIECFVLGLDGKTVVLDDFFKVLEMHEEGGYHNKELDGLSGG